MPIEPFEFTYTLTSQASENEVLNALGKTRVKEFEPKSYFFTESSLPAQTSSTGAYGPDGSTKFNITTQFNLTDKKAYAVTSGQVLIVPQTGSTTKVNAFIKPLSHIDVGVPIKYYVYRGLKKESFIDATNNILTKDTTNSPFMAKVWDDLIYFNNLAEPLPLIPATLFGYNTTDSSDTRLDAKFFNVVEDTTTDENKIYNLANIEAGQHFGEFADNEGGFEIVLNDGFYHQEKSDTGFEFDMTYAKAKKVTLDIADITGSPTISEKIYRENVQNFLDPAAFYGAHITEKENGKITVVDIASKYSSKEAIFTNIVDKFYNRHKCYLYFQCNRGRSFNFDEVLGTEPLKIGVAETVSPSLYQTDGWPIIISEFEQTHTDEETDAKKGVNDVSFQLKFKTVNKNVTLYNSYGNCANETVEGNFLGSKALVDEVNIATQEYTNTVKYKLTNNYNILGSTSLTTKSIASFIYINHEEKEVEYFNDFFGPIQIDHLMKSNDPSNQKKAKKSSSEKLRIKNSTIDNKSNVSKFSFTTIPYLNSSNDDLFRLYTLKRIGSEDSKDRTFRENTSSDYVFAEINSTDDYGQFQYRDKNYKVWKGQITDDAATINTLQLINFEGEGNVTNFIHLGLMNDDYNKVIYDSLTSDTTNHIPDTKKDIYFHLEETVTTEPSSLYKKYILGVKVVTFDLFWGVSYDYIYPSSENTVYVYTVDGHYFFTKEFSEKFQYVEEFGDASVNFRTPVGHNGEFGFDWLRIGDVGEPSYENSIVSGYEESNWTGFEFNTEFDSPTEAFEALKKEYINIKTKKLNISTQKRDEMYYVPYLNIYPKTAIESSSVPSEVTLRGVIVIDEDLVKIRYEYDANLFSVSSNPTTQNMTLLGGLTYDVEVTIICLKEFDKDQVIKVIASSQNLNEPIKDKTIGIIKICKNSKEANRQNLKTVLVKVKTNIENTSSSIVTGTYFADEKKYLNNGLYQSFVYGDIEEVVLPLDNDPKFKDGGTYISDHKIKWFEDGIHEYLRDKLINSDLGSKFKNYCMCFSFDVESALDSKGASVYGHAQSVGKQVVIVYKDRGMTTLTHEILHGLGLYHTHREVDAVSGQPTKPIIYFNDKFVYHHADHLLNLTPPENILKATDNFMSYNRNDRKITWHWQWKIIRDNIKKYTYL